MSKSVKIWLITATSLVLAGALVFGGVMTLLQWDFGRLFGNSSFETTIHEAPKDFNDIEIHTDTANIKLVLSSDNKCRIECKEHKKIKHTVDVEDQTLKISVLDTRKWYEYIGINFGSPEITVYLPKSEYGTLSVKSSTGKVEMPDDFNFQSIDVDVSIGGVTCSASALGDVKIKTSTGDINVENICAKTLDLTVSTGKITVTGAELEGDLKIKVSTGKSKLQDIKCKNIATTGSTGDIILTNVIAQETLSIERSTGDVTLSKSDAGELLIKTDTGDVKGTLLSEKVFIVSTDTGKIDVPKSTSGGKCEIATDTGDIKITID